MVAVSDDRKLEVSTVSEHAKPFAPMPGGPELPPHMSVEEFREAAGELVEFICDYYAGIEQRRVRPGTVPGEVFEALPAAPPASGGPFDDVLGDVSETVLPHLTHWQHPGFFGYFPANASFPAILGDLLSSALGVQGMLWQTSPACTEVETRVLDWLALALGLPGSFTSTGVHPSLHDHAELRGLIGEPLVGRAGAEGEPDAGGGVILSTASEAVLTALAAALGRHRRSAESVQQPMVYTSAQAHSSVQKALGIVGLDGDNIRIVPTDGVGAMDAKALRSAMQTDAEDARRPVFVCVTLGTTGTGAFDPLRSVGKACVQHGAWLHVDAAWAGSAYVCPEFRDTLRGVEHADSFSFNPHKWLLTNFDCSLFYLNGAEARGRLTQAMSITPEYLRNAASDEGGVIDYRNWHIPLGRRFRALKLWFVLRHYGVKGLQAHVRTHVRQAAALERVIDADDRFELAAPRSLSLVLFRVARDDAAGTLSREVMDRVNEEGHAFLTHTTLPVVGGDGRADGEGEAGRFVIRVAIGGTLTRDEHVRKLWQRVVESYESLHSRVKGP
jgi:aromatic-L-amino-acid decarboxylase